jgi:CheY-like chemotaxis protein
MIHGLAKQLDGGFTLDSTVGLGTIATLWLPAADSDAAPAAPQRQSRVPFARKLKILVVDDDLLILMNTSALLEDLGHEVLEASSGEEALTFVRQYPDIDLVITDQAMPQMTGTQLADQVTDIRAELPIILASGYGDVPAGSQQRIVRLGKPFGQTMLDQAISAAMAG